MRRALELARRGGVRTRPNPNVGAVVVRGGRVVGEGWHRALGEDHAEAVALRAAGARARGATLYVTLEPCAHVGRTPPCVDAILAARVGRCVVATRDPHAIVNGRGLRRLRAGGVRVTLGVLEREARELLGAYAFRHRHGRPRVTWKVAATLDGRIADPAGRSRWITNTASRAHVHRLRAAADAIVVGAGTAAADDPRLTARGRGVVRQPLRIVVDSALALPPTLRLFGPALARGTIVACGPRASRARESRLLARGVRVWRLPAPRGAVSAAALLARLAAHGCHDVMLECGPGLGTPWLRRGLVDRVAVFVAPRVLGADSLAWLGRWPGRSLARARGGRLLEQRRFGDDAYLLVEVAR